MQTRMNRISDGTRLDEGDICYFFGEYISGGKWDASPTNQLIFNLKADLVQQPQRRVHKKAAIEEAIEQLVTAVSAGSLEKVTVVPMPGSKPVGHEGYDDRMLQIMSGWRARIGPTFDGRPVLVTAQERAPQHLAAAKGLARATVDELAATLALDPQYLTTPLRETVVLLDDVFTAGTSFKAAQRVLLQRPEVKKVCGLFLARTVWPPQAKVDVSGLLATLRAKLGK